MPKAVRTSNAERDLREITLRIGIEDKRPQVAYRIVDEIIAKCDLYADNPRMDTPSPDLGEDYRMFSHKRWVIVFRPIAEGIEVMRVVDGSRDYGRLF